jgi:hypothetical protein
MVPRIVALVVLVFMLAGPVHGQSKSPVEGVWKVAEVQVIGGQSPGTQSTPQPGFYIFTRGHYSVMTINSAKPRSVLPGGPGQPTTTDAQKIALYDHWALSRPMAAPIPSKAAHSRPNHSWRRTKA